MTQFVKLANVAQSHRGLARHVSHLKSLSFPPFLSFLSLKLFSINSKKANLQLKLNAAEIPVTLPFRFEHDVRQCTVGQNSQELGHKYWATRSSICSFTRTAHLHRSLIHFLRTARFARALRCAHFANSIACGKVNY